MNMNAISTVSDVTFDILFVKSLYKQANPAFMRMP